jgi:DNA-binding beta-propeller fold protein YncE
VAAMSIDPSGNIYVLDNYYSRVTKWTPGASTGILVAGGNGSGTNISQLSYPYGMFVEPNTSIIWIADSGNNRVVKWSSPSTVVLIAGSFGINSNQFNNPMGLFVDLTASYTLYVADSNNHRIQKWLSGAINGTTVAGQTGVSGSGLNQLSYPTTLILDQNRTMYIVDNGNNRIMQWFPGSSSGVLIAGTNTYGNLPNQLKNPVSVRLDSSEALIIADDDNNRIQRFAVVCCK